MDEMLVDFQSAGLEDLRYFKQWKELRNLAKESTDWLSIRKDWMLLKDFLNYFDAEMLLKHLFPHTGYVREDYDCVCPKKDHPETQPVSWDKCITICKNTVQIIIDRKNP